MDRKYTFIGILLLVAAGVLFFVQAQQAARRANQPRPTPATAPATTGAPEAAPTSLPTAEAPATVEGAPTPASVEAGALPTASVNPAPATVNLPPEELYTLENDYLRVRWTNRGGAIRDIAVKQYPKQPGKTEPYVMNWHGEAALSLAFGRDDGPRFAPAFRLVRHDEEKREIVFAFTDAAGNVITRSYTLGTGTEASGPYTVAHKVTFQAGPERALDLTRLFVNAGTAAPPEADQVQSTPDSIFFLNFGYFDGGGAHFTDIMAFRASGGFLGIGAREARTQIEQSARVDWASVKNQFFATVLTPSVPGAGFAARPVNFPQPPNIRYFPQGVTGSVLFNLGQVAPGQTQELAMTYYTGPKEYSRLVALGGRQDEVMQYGWTGFISSLLLYLLKGLQFLVGNWGVAIVIMVLIIRTLIWPLTAQAVVMSKRMQKVTPLFKELQEKYKDNPEKLNREMLKLWQVHKVNPLGGCLPLFVQLPIFFALFSMLRSAAELRYEGFLWIQDLSMADTVAHIGGFPINPLPILMGVTMFYQMTITPMTMDPTQRKIMMFMPVLPVIFCYGSSAGLSLYWTMSGLFSIGQQFVINKMMKDEEDKQAANAAGIGKDGKKPTLQRETEKKAAAPWAKPHKK